MQYSCLDKSLKELQICYLLPSLARLIPVTDGAEAWKMGRGELEKMRKVHLRHHLHFVMVVEEGYGG